MAATRVSTVIERVLKDDHLHAQVRKASEALTDAGRRALGKPEPEPPRRRGRRLAILVVGVSVLALVRSMHRAQQAAATPPAAGSSAA